MVKKGDTLIEVTLAIGIFSMVAITVTSVLNSATSNTQTALETTLTREEIDTQAEAIRYIHSAYAANKEEGKIWTTAWRAIKDKAINPNTTAATNIRHYSPTTCDVSNLPTNAFIIDAKTTLSYISLSTGSGGNYVKTSSFPQVYYNGDLTKMRARGIYVVAVKGDTTSKPAYYDFYIQTCWYGSNANEPSTVSTLIRLHNPDAI